MVLESVIAFVIGLAVGLLLFALLLPATNKRQRARHQAVIDRYEAELSELRQERADDRETNRRLRRELAINTPHSLEATREERNRAIEELDKLSSELRHATMELADRDRSLREARLAIHDIRVQLERDRFNLGIDDHGEADGAVAGLEAVNEAVIDGAGSAIDNAVSALDEIVAGIDDVADETTGPLVVPEPPMPPAPPTPPMPPQAEPVMARPATLRPPSILNADGEVEVADDDLEQPAAFGPAFADGSHEALEPALSDSDASSS